MFSSRSLQNAGSLPVNIYGDVLRIRKIFFWFTALILFGQSAGILIVLTTKDTLFALIIAISIPPILPVFFLIRRNRFELSAVVLALILLAMLTVLSTAGLGIHNVSNIAFPAIMIIASMVTRKRTMALLTLFAVGCVSWLVIGELSGAYVPEVLVRSVPGDLLSASLAIIMTALMVRVLSESLFQNNVRLQQQLAERKLAEEALRDSDRKLRLLIDHSVQGVLLYENDRLGYVNSRLCEISGYSEDELTGILPQRSSSLVHPDDRARVDERSRRYMRGEPVEELDSYRIVRKNGEIRHVEVSAKSIRLDEKPIGIVTMIDITERKQAEAAVRESEEKFRTLFDQASDSILVLDPSAPGCPVIVDANQTACQAHGYEYVELIGKPIAELDDQKNAARVVERLELVKAGERVIFETVHKRKDGSLFPVEVSARLVNRTEKSPVVFTTDRDITERKKGEREHEKLQMQLNQAQRMELVGRLAGGVAHDFNNLLHVILGNAEMALEALTPGVHLYDSMQEIQDAARRSANLIRQLLAFARKQDVVPRLLDLNDALSGMLKMLQRLIGEDIELVWKPGAGLWQVKVDPSQLDQVMANLSVNARDAIDGAGNLVLSTENVVIDENWCRTHAGWIQGQYVLLTVSDSGAGMSQEILEHLFEPFFTTKSVGQGTGLGLATIYGIVKQNSGFISVVSEPGLGSTFKIYLPRAQEVMEAGPAALEKKPVLGTETVLLVEDEQSILKLTQTLLERLGYTVLAALTPSAALAQAAQYAGPLHLLLTDVVMPEMDGRQLHRKVAALRPGIKALFMSGYTADVLARRGVIEEGVQFLRKPFSLYALSTSLREALNRK